MSEKQELAMCGCRCDVCKAYTPNVEKNDQRETLAKMWNKYYGLDPSVMDSCGGCKSNPSDENCPVRKCVLEKGLTHCGDCGDFPCNVFYKRYGSFPEEKKKDFDMDEYNEYILAYDNETRLKEYRAKQEQLKGSFPAFSKLSGHVRSFDMADEIWDGESWDKGANKVYSRCGQRCDLCLIYRPNVLKEDRRADICAVWDKLGPQKYNPERTICDGCMADSKDAVLFSGGECKARKCVIEKGLQHCGYCSDYPCDIYPAEPDADEFYKDMERRGVDWTAEDDKMMEPYNPKRLIDEWRRRQNIDT